MKLQYDCEVVTDLVLTIHMNATRVEHLFQPLYVTLRQNSAFRDYMYIFLNSILTRIIVIELWNKL